MMITSSFSFIQTYAIVKIFNITSCKIVKELSVDQKKYKDNT